MRQWWTVPGKSGGLLELRDVDPPSPGPGQMLIAVGAAGVNRGELIARSAQRIDNPAARPRRSGIECAGKVLQLGETVAGYVIGDRVMARASACHAEITCIDADAAMRIPDHLDFAQAAAVPNAFVTAHDAMITNARFTKGEKVLVTAGSSGVGTAAIQIAAFLGAGQIIASTRNPDKSELLQRLGATAVVVTGNSSWTTQVQTLCGGVDVVIDQVGGELFPELMNCMSVGGRYVSVGRNAGAATSLDLDQLARDRLKLMGVTFRTRSAAEALACSQRFAQDLLAPLADGQLQPTLDRCFPLDQLPDAHKYMLSNQQFGKIVLTV